MCRCLYCYKPLNKEEKDFHPQCAKKFFGTLEIPLLDYTLNDIDSLALQVIEAQTSLTGVQPKLSLNIQKHNGENRLTIVGLFGDYICKPQTSQFEQMPEVEDLTMHLAEVAQISVVPHTLIRMADDSICYLARRIDRTKDGEKIPMEDMCQLSLKQTEYKYHGSYEQIAKIIAKYCKTPKLNVMNFFDVVLFSWLTGNNDMHLKNFSLYSPTTEIYSLTPAYDLINARIINPKDDEELALPLNGKKKRLKLQDFISSAKRMGIDEIVVMHLFEKYKKLIPKFEEMINVSFLNDELKEKYILLLKNRLEL